MDPFDYAREDLNATLSTRRMAILVWGPGPSNPDHHAKREKIRDELRKSFPRAEVRFSEDPELNRLFPFPGDLSVKRQELWHLACCDVCIVLDSSKGAGEEIAHFSGSSLAFKLQIFTDEEYKGTTTFPAFLRENLNQHFYTKAEFTDCSLVARVLEQVRSVALSKWLGLPG